MKPAASEEKTQSITIFKPTIFISLVILSFIGAIIGIQIIVSLGISANTSIIGAVLALLLSRIPMALFSPFKVMEAQNLMQTSISAATFAAANGLIIAIGVPWVLGSYDLIWPMLFGCFLALLVDSYILYNIFNTTAFPATGGWPSGVATAETLIAGNKGGNRLYLLIVGFIIGSGGVMAGIPMASAGIALIGARGALFMFAIGLLVRGYSVPLFNYDINIHYIPHGIMIGAGIVALLQIAYLISTKPKAVAKNNVAANPELALSGARLRKGLIRGGLFYFIVAVFLTLSTKIFTDMSWPMLIGFLAFATFASLMQEMVVGMAAMHSGWFPAMAASLISLILGLLIGFPPMALAVLVGFCIATGPAFADLGFDFKTGYIIRGHGQDAKRESLGRYQQYLAALVGFFCAILMVALVYKIYFEAGQIAPASKVFAATIKAGSSPEIAIKLFFWAIVGAAIQFLGGVRNQIGILFATGLIISFPIAGWTVLVSLAIRWVLESYFKVDNNKLATFAGGLIAGDALTAAVTAFLPTIKAKLLAFMGK